MNLNPTTISPVMTMTFRRKLRYGMATLNYVAFTKSNIYVREITIETHLLKRVGTTIMILNLPVLIFLLLKDETMYEYWHSSSQNLSNLLSSLKTSVSNLSNPVFAVGYEQPFPHSPHTLCLEGFGGVVYFADHNPLERRG